MNKRIKILRDQSLSTQPFISSERAELITDFYRSNQNSGHSAPLIRAMAFDHILMKKEICLNEGELIVGERGPSPKATPTYPEITLHKQDDFSVLHSRKKTAYSVSDGVRKIYDEEIIPFWDGRTIRDRIMENMTEEWKNAYEAGVFTEFMEQRAPGHTVLDDKIYGKGFLDLIHEIDRSMDILDDERNPEVLAKKEQLKAMRLAAEALIRYAARHARKAESLAALEKNNKRKQELLEIAEICRRVPARSPRNFWEALQFYWFVHLGVIIELNGWDSFNPGRLDQHLYPFYRNELKRGSLTKEKARELLQAFWIKFNNQPAPPKVGVTAEESSTYTDFALINTGGVTADGTDAVNELSYLILDVIEEMRILQPSSAIQVSQENPDAFIQRALRILKTGFGQPSIFNTEAIVQELVRQGKTLEDARNGGASGCVEVGAFGKENYTLTGYFNLVKVLEITLFNGRDPRTQKKIGLETGEASEFPTYQALLEAFDKQLKHFLSIKLKGNDVIERLYAEQIPAPFLSLLIDDCIANGKDYHCGGARYNTSYIQGVGLGSISDSLASIKSHVYDKKNLNMQELTEAMTSNFKDREILRQTLVNKTPKYGNDDDAADTCMQDVFRLFFNAVDGRPNTKGGHYRINLLPTTVHVYFGKVVGAMPDGRKAGEPLSEGISPVQGADRKGPTAVIKSASKMDHLLTGGTLLNQKFTPHLLASKEGILNLTALIRAYFKLKGHHIQLNVVDAATLKAAKAHPENYRDLIVRVAGYSDYFCDLSDALQDEIISRTEQGKI